MQTSVSSNLSTKKGEYGHRQLTALMSINIAKAISIVVLIAIIMNYGMPSKRALLYTSLHVTYLIWWLLQQYLAPTMAKQMFQEKLSAGMTAFCLVFIGVVYVSPALGAFWSKSEITDFEMFACVWVYTTGSLLNAAADFYKLGGKVANNGQSLLLTGDCFRLSRFIHYFGDWMRYATFAYLGERWWAYLILLNVIASNYSLAQKRDEVALSKYGAEYKKYMSCTPMFIPWKVL